MLAQIHQKWKLPLVGTGAAATELVRTVDRGLAPPLAGYISGLASGRDDRLAAKAVQRPGEKLSGADSRCWTNRSSPPFTEKL